MKSLTNGIFQEDKYYRSVFSFVVSKPSSEGLPEAKYVLAQQDDLYKLFLEHNEVDPFSIVEDELKKSKSNLKKTFGSDHPILNRIAKYFFKVAGTRGKLAFLSAVHIILLWLIAADGTGKRVRPTIILLVSDAINRTVVKGTQLNFTIYLTKSSDYPKELTVYDKQVRLSEITEVRIIFQLYFYCICIDLLALYTLP